MSIEKLTKSERATYFVGKAITDAMVHIEKIDSPKMKEAKKFVVCALMAKACPEGWSAMLQTPRWYARFLDYAESVVEAAERRRRME